MLAAARLSAQVASALRALALSPGATSRAAALELAVRQLDSINDVIARLAPDDGATVPLPTVVSARPRRRPVTGPRALAGTAG